MIIYKKYLLLSKFILVILFILALPIQEIKAQGSVKRNQKNISPEVLHYIDSLKNTPYTNLLPVFGVKTQAAGFEMPLPLGLMVNVLSSQQNLTISDLAINFNQDANMAYVGGFARFDPIKPRIINYNFRPDIWIFPFLNISGLFGSFSSTTPVRIINPFVMDFEAENNGTLAGFGILVAGGAGPIFATASYNQVWSYTKLMIDNGVSYNAGVRIGHNRKNNRKPIQSWSVWGVVEWLQLNKHTYGKVNLNDLTGITQNDKISASDELNEWYDGLPPVKQAAFKKIKEPLDDWLNNGTDTELFYDFNKTMVEPFSYGLGAQYKFNKHWQIQFESTVTGFNFDRWRLTFGATYRFAFNMNKNKII